MSSHLLPSNLWTNLHRIPFLPLPSVPNHEMSLLKANPSISDSDSSLLLLQNLRHSVFSVTRQPITHSVFSVFTLSLCTGFFFRSIDLFKYVALTSLSWSFTGHTHLLFAHLEGACTPAVSTSSSPLYPTSSLDSVLITPSNLVREWPQITNHHHAVKATGQFLVHILSDFSVVLNTIGHLLLLDILDSLHPNDITLTYLPFCLIHRMSYLGPPIATLNLSIHKWHPRPTALLTT